MISLSFNVKDLDTTERMVSSIRAGMKREFAFIMKAQSEIGELPSGRRVTRSQSVVSPSRGSAVAERKISKKMKGSDSKKLKKDEKEILEGEEENLGMDEQEKLGGEEGEGKLGFVDVLGGENGSNRAVVEVASNIDDCSRSLEADLAVVGVSEAEKVGGSDRVPINEDDRTLRAVSGLECQITEEGSSMASEKHVRRFTRSALKVQDEDTELGAETEVGAEAGAGAVSIETLTLSPSKLEMKMSKKIGLNRIPGKLRDLLETGLLEGLPVRYIHGSKVSIFRNCFLCVETL